MKDETPFLKGQTRRTVLTAMGATAVSAAIDSRLGFISPALAQADESSAGRLRPNERVTIDALSEVLLPGAGAAGVARYIDYQLGQAVPLLFLRYMDYPSSFFLFYRQGLRSLQRESLSRFGCRFENASPDEQRTLVQDLSQSSPPEWSGPPAPLFYFVLRNDTVDVFYGTPAGFEKLGLPYQAMLQPPSII